LLGPLGKPAVPCLIDLLSDVDEDVRAQAADCLGNIGPTASEAESKLLLCANDPSDVVECSAISVLARIKAKPN